MTIPQVDPWITEDDVQAVTGPLQDNWITEGDRADEFRDRLLDRTGAPHGVFAPNGTLALALGLLALDVGPGDEVLVPDTTFVGSATSVALTGAQPVFTPVTRSNFQIDADACENLVTEDTAAVMPVHLYGMSANMDDVMALASEHDLDVIEDAAQAVGVEYRGRHAGTFGDVGCFSFFADKTITTGEGGFVVCNDEEIHERLLYLRNQGRRERGSFKHPEIGYNFRITDLQAALGIVQMDKLPEIVERKRRIHSWYEERLADVDEVEFLDVEPGSDLVPFRVVLLCEDRPGLEDHLEDDEIQTRGAFYPLHRQPCFEHLPGDDDRYPNAVHAYEHGLLLPVHPTLSEKEVDHVCRSIRRFYEA